MTQQLRFVSEVDQPDVDNRDSGLVHDVSTVQLGDTCSLYIDMPPEQPGPERGDWIVTAAGSRYLVAAARSVRPRQPRPAVRWQLTVYRLPKRSPVPADVRAVDLRWYRR